MRAGCSPLKKDLNTFIQGVTVMTCFVAAVRILFNTFLTICFVKKISEGVV